MSRHCEIVVHSDFYDFIGLDVECVIQLFVKKHKEIKKWAYILHDKDEGMPHYHIYLYFGVNGPDYETVAKWFIVPSRCVGAIRGSFNDYLLYLVHFGRKCKHQYSPREVKASFDFESALSKDVLSNRG